MAVNVKDAIIEILRGISAPENLTQENSHRFRATIEEQLNANGYTCTTAQGISKMAIVFKNFDFVLKIPFRGMECDCYGDSYDEENDEREMDEYGFYSFENAEATEEGGACWNYCELELSIGSDAKAKGLGAYLPEVTFIEKINNYYVYEQAKASVLEELSTYKSLSRNSEKRTEEFCNSNRVWCFNTLWIENFIREYGEQEFLILNDFLNEYCVDDLHDGNLGYIDGKPVIIDYASYRDF